MGKYDAVIIGAGLSGLMAAAQLSGKKKKVLVLEQHSTVGGLAAGFRRKDYYFDSSIHCFMASSTTGFYERLGIYDKLDFRPHRASINIEGNILNASNAEELTEELCRVFPDESEGIRRFYDERVKRLAAFINMTTVLGNPMYYKGFKSFTKTLKMFSIISKLGFDTLSQMAKPDGKTANDVLGEYISRDSRAYKYLCNKINDITYKGNFAMPNYAGNWVWPFPDMYPYNGFQGMSDEFANVVRERGGEILTGARVTKVIMEDGRAKGVEYLRDGIKNIVEAPAVISAIDLKKTFLGLVGGENLEKEFSKTFRKQEMSSAVPILYLGVGLDREKLRSYFNGLEEIFYIPELKVCDNNLSDRDYYRNTSVRIASSCLINPGHAPENKANLQIYLPAPPVGWLDNWGVRDGQKTEEYRSIKEMVISQVLDVVEKIIPELKDRSRIEVCELGTPFTIERFTGNSEGSHGGFTWEREKCLVTGDKIGKFFSRYNKIEGLYTIGHQTGYLGGITNALWSADNITGEI